MTTEKKTHRNSTEMFPLIETMLNSHQNQNQFCAEQGLSLAVMQYWLRKYRSAKEASGKEGFVALSVAGPVEEVSGIEIIFTDGTRLRCSGPVEATWLRSVMGQSR